MEYNFKTMSDAELLKMGYRLDEELNAKLLRMKLDPEIAVLSTQLDEIQVEKIERGL